jgi:hypothetical protein
MDAFVRVGPLIGLRDAQLLRAAMVTVFSTIEPEADPNDVFLRPNPTGYSEWLREGLATTLLLFAVWSGPAEINLGGETGQAFANQVLNELPGLRTDARLLTSLRNELPLLAEAAPGPLLSALEHMLEGDGSLIRPIFNERHLPGWPFPETRHIGVLRALETLAWDPEHFRQAVLVLAGLAAIDPHSRQGNSPGQSLAEIFVLWNPNTNASSSQRLSALDEISVKYPDLGWALLLTLLPTLHGASSPTAKPKLREAGAADRPPITYKELWDNQAAVSQRVVRLAGYNSARWIELVGPLTGFGLAERAQAVAALNDTLASVAGEERRALWARLRDEIDRHERFKDAPWALPEEELVPLRALADKYAPTDPVANLVMMFDREDFDDNFGRTKTVEHRAASLKQLYAEEGATAILRLVSEVRVPYWVVEAAAAARFNEAEIGDLLSHAVEQCPDSGFAVGLSMLYRDLVGPERAQKWLRKIKNASADLFARLLQGWPDGPDTWRAVRRLGPDVTRAYWTERPPRHVEGSRHELLGSLNMRLRYGRAVEAIQSSLSRLAEVPTKMALRMLDGVIPQLNARAAPADTMTVFYVERMLQALDERSDVSDVDIAVREFKFLPFLEHGHRKLRLYHLMATDPGFYHLMLRNVFLAKTEEKREIDSKTQEQARLSYSLLSHFSLLPGQRDGEIDAAALTAWIDEVRRLGAETDRAEITDSYVGRVLAHAPADPDGAWPHRVVRDQIERISSEEVEHAIQIERFNMRGAHWRDPFGGGNQERNFAKASLHAAELAAPWPRTATLLRAIGKMWEENAKHADLDAAQRRLRS